MNKIRLLILATLSLYIVFSAYAYKMTQTRKKQQIESVGKWNCFELEFENGTIVDNCEETMLQCQMLRESLVDELSDLSQEDMNSINIKYCESKKQAFCFDPPFQNRVCSSTEARCEFNRNFFKKYGTMGPCTESPLSSRPLL